MCDPLLKLSFVVPYGYNAQIPLTPNTIWRVVSPSYVPTVQDYSAQNLLYGDA